MKQPRTISEFEAWARTLPKFRPGKATIAPMQGLCQKFNHPELAYRTIHIAGTKGKGTTAKSCACILEASGKKCGLLTSPEVYDFRERFMSAREFFQDEIYETALAELFSVLSVSELEAHTRPEILTLFGFLCFKIAKVDYAAIEVGLGGRFDPTNVISPEVCVLLPIELEHVEILGDTIEKITSEKAGITKPGVPVVISSDATQSQIELYRRFINPDAPIYTASTPVHVPLKLDSALTASQPSSAPESASAFLQSTLAAFPTNFFRANFKTAFAACQIAERHLAVHSSSPDALANAIAAMPGRFETVHYKNATYILDIAHTKNSLAGLLETNNSYALIAMQDYHKLTPADLPLQNRPYDLISITDKNLENYFSEIIASEKDTLITGSVEVVRRFKNYLARVAEA